MRTIVTWTGDRLRFELHPESKSEPDWERLAAAVKRRAKLVLEASDLGEAAQVVQLYLAVDPTTVGAANPAESMPHVIFAAPAPVSTAKSWWGRLLEFMSK